MKHKCFTLIELLVVISIITMLIAILTSILWTVKEHSKAVICGSNIRQLSSALIMYAQENETFPPGFDIHDRIEPPGGRPGDAVFDDQGWWWFNFLTDLQGGNVFNKESVLWCPSNRIEDFLLKGNVLCGNYGVNQYICKQVPQKNTSEFVGIPLAHHKISHSAETLLITDSGYSLISWRGASNASGPYFSNPQREGAFYVPGITINKERTISPGFEQDAINGRHLNKSVNVGFADGHVNRLRADNLFVEEINGKYNNLSPLWLPK